MYINSQISTDTIPKIESVEFQSVSKNYLKLLVIRILIFYIAVMILLISTIFIEQLKIDSFLQWLTFGGATIIVVLLLTLSIYGFSKRKYALRTHDILYSQGVLVNKLTTVAYARIQHIEVSSSLFERKLHLATLRIYTAGDSGSDLVIKGLKESEAHKINSYLSARMNGEF
ncbi:MAG: PH domain-containing protein [Aquaticitalea sp.]